MWNQWSILIIRLDYKGNWNLFHKHSSQKIEQKLFFFFIIQFFDMRDPYYCLFFLIAIKKY